MNSFNKWKGLTHESIGQSRKRSLSEGQRKPARTITELAEEFGVTRQALVNQMRADTSAPKPIFKLGCGESSKSTWYNPQDVRAWWIAKKAMPDARS